MRPKQLHTLTKMPPNKEATAASLQTLVTPVSSFFVRTHFSIPKVDVSGWALSVEGIVQEPLSLTYAQLKGMPRVSIVATLECAGNGRSAFPVPAKNEVAWGTGAVGTARWSGVRLSTILRMAGMRKEATEVVAEGLDQGTPGGRPERIGFSRSLPLEKALAAETLVALGMNGRELSPEHGFPARLVVPGWYGMASVKWLSKITVISGEPYFAFFNGEKYVYVYEKNGREVREPVGELRVSSAITSPVEGDKLKVGVPVKICGKAWSGQGRIASVEVDTGGGWAKASLAKPLGRYAWANWTRNWVPRTRGRVRIFVRAHDSHGNVQPSEPLENRYQYGCNVMRSVAIEVV